MGGKKQGLAYEEVQGGDGAEFWGVSILPANPGGKTPAAVHGHQSQRNRGDAWIFQPSVLPLIFQESSGHDALRVSETVKRRKGEGGGCSWETLFPPVFPFQERNAKIAIPAPSARDLSTTFKY